MRMLMIVALMMMTFPSMATGVDIYIRLKGEPWGQPVASFVIPEQGNAPFANQVTLATMCEEEEHEVQAWVPKPTCTPHTRTHTVVGTVSPTDETLAKLSFTLKEQNITLNANIPRLEAIAMDFGRFEPTQTMELRVQTSL